MRRPAVGLLFALLLAVVTAVPAAANHGPMTGHLPPSNANVDLISKLKVSNIVPEWVTDVATYRDTAYLGAWNIQCQGAGNPNIPGGFWSVDISDPANPRELTFVSSPPGSYLTEGVHAFRMTTPSFTGDVLLVSQEICLGSTVGVGGFSLYDVSNPAAPQPLAMSVGDQDPVPTYGTRPHPAHTAFGWDTGDKAYVAVMDNAEQLDIDIFDITNPRAPVMIRETGITDVAAGWGRLSPQRTFGNNPGLHDLIVRRVEGHWLMLASYWDAGYVVLNVDDPANPVFVKDSDHPDPDRLTGFSPPEGNAHEAEWDRCPEEGVRSAFPCGDVRYIIAADEDFSPYRLQAPRITSGPFAGQTFGGIQAPDAPQLGVDVLRLAGPTYFAGLACGPLPAAPSPNAVAVVERGVCAFEVKLTNVENAGYAGGLVFNSAAPGNCEALVNMGVNPGHRIPFIFVSRSTGYRILGITGYNTANCPSGTNPPLPAVGTRGSNIDITAVFDGWAYVHLLNADTMQHIDQYSIPQALDERFAKGFGVLTVHEVTTDPTADVGYVSWYSAGLRVLDFSTGKLQEVGHHIDERGNDHWGVELNVRRDGRQFILASDRDYGLYIYRFGTDLRPTKVSSVRSTRVGRAFTYTVRVRNTGTIAETNTVVRDRLPRGVRFLGASSSQGRCSYRSASRTVVCNLGTLANDASGVLIRIRVRATRAGTWRNTAIVGGVRAEYDIGNNRASTRTRIARAPRPAPPLTGRQG